VQLAHDTLRWWTKIQEPKAGSFEGTVSSQLLPLYPDEPLVVAVFTISDVAAP